MYKVFESIDYFFSGIEGYLILILDVILFFFISFYIRLTLRMDIDSTIRNGMHLFKANSNGQYSPNPYSILTHVNPDIFQEQREKKKLNRIKKTNRQIDEIAKIAVSASDLACGITTIVFACVSIGGLILCFINSIELSGRYADLILQLISIIFVFFVNIFISGMIRKKCTKFEYEKMLDIFDKENDISLLVDKSILLSVIIFLPINPYTSISFLLILLSKYNSFSLTVEGGDIKGRISRVLQYIKKFLKPRSLILMLFGIYDLLFFFLSFDFAVLNYLYHHPDCWMTKHLVNNGMLAHGLSFGLFFTAFGIVVFLSVILILHRSLNGYFQRVFQACYADSETKRETIKQDRIRYVKHGNDHHKRKK